MTQNNNQEQFLTKTDSEVFLFEEGDYQLFPNKTIITSAAVVTRNAEDDYSHLKVVNGQAIELTPEERAALLAKEQEDHLNFNKGQLLRELDELLGTTAQQYGYDSIKTVVTYADEPAVPQFQTEGKAFRKWRSECYAFAYTNAPNITVDSTFEEFKVGLPILDLPLPNL